MDNKVPPRAMQATRWLLWVSLAVLLLTGVTILGTGTWWQQVLYLGATIPLIIAVIMMEIERSN